MPHHLTYMADFCLHFPLTSSNTFILLYAVLSLQDVFACTVHVAHVYNVCGTWDRPTNKVRTVDRVRVNGLNGLNGW